MRRIDRLIKIIYDKIPLSSVFIAADSPSISSISKGFPQSWHGAFMLQLGSNFFDLVKNEYMVEYQKFNTDDEADIVIEHYNASARKGMYSKYEHNALNLLAYIADELLQYKAGKLTVPFEHLLEWNGLIDKVDSQIFFAMKSALTQMEIRSDDVYKISHDNERLNIILNKGISENHMHFKGSGYTTDLNWYDFSNSNSLADGRLEMILSKRWGKIYDESIHFYKLRLIKLYLYQGKLKRDYDPLIDKFNASKSEYKLITQEQLLALLRCRTLDEYQVLLARLKETTLINYLVERFDNFCLTFEHNPKQSFLVERAYLKFLFEDFLKGELSDFEVYLLNSYLVGINKFKHFFHQTNHGMGFEKFKESEDIKEILLEQEDFSRIASTVFDKYYSEGCIDKVEFRFAPKSNVEDYNHLIRELEYLNNTFFENYSKDNLKRLEYGIIIHFIKDKNDFDVNNGVARKARTLESLHYQANVLVNFFEQQTNPYIKKIVGIDTANYELNVRPEVFGTTFRRIRKKISESHHLNFTYHVGEDFLTIANGLRAMDETIEFLGFKRGDRFGHGMALGHNIDTYFKIKQNQIYSSVEDYLTDIVWMYYLIEHHKDSKVISDFESVQGVSVNALLRFLEREFEREIQKFPFDYSVSLYDYFCSYKLRGDDPEIYFDLYYDQTLIQDFEKQYVQLKRNYNTRLNYHNPYHKEAFRNKKARDLNFYYHYSKKVKEMHSDKKLKFVAKETYINCVKLVQKLLFRKVYDLEIGIETNPSSNRKISFVSKYKDLPFLTFNNRYLARDDERCQLAISINSDDSAIFQTDLSLEYSYIVAALFREGYHKEDIYDYINYLRKMGQAQSFISEDNMINESHCSNLFN